VDKAYLAPESIQTGKVELSGDVYAFGAVILQLVLRSKKLYYDVDPELILKEVGEGRLSPILPEQLLDDSRRPYWIPKLLVELIQSCLDKDSSKRPTMKEISEQLKAM